MVGARAVPEVADLVTIGTAAGLDAVGVASAAPFATTRRHLERRRTAGYHGGMAFTYRRPDRSSDPSRALSGARSLVVGARSYRRTAAVRPSGSTIGAVARYAWEDHYRPLREALGVIARRLGRDGWRTRVLADDNALVDREAAYRAGLGWYGKNANLLLPGQGSWFVLGSVVTDAPLAETRPPARVGDGCGSCTRCIDACPTGAIVGPGVVDARRCLAWLLQMDGPFPVEHRVALDDRLYGCDDCQEVCPPTRRAARGKRAPAVGPDATVWVDLVELLGSNDDDLMARYGRWYVPRRQARYLRRNALIVLGNVADPNDARVVDAIREALGHDDPLVRGHAVWAARRLGLGRLIDGMAVETDPYVRQELALSVEARR